MNALFDVNAPHPTASSLADFRLTFEGHIRVLKALESNTKESGFVFAHLLLRKLPTTTRDNLNKAKRTDVWDLDQLRKLINDEIQHLTELQDKSYQESNVVKISDNLTHTSSFPINASKYNFIQCRYCSSDHFSHLCTKYNSVELRRLRVNELNLYYNCLRSKHVVTSCMSKDSCRNCSKRNYTTLCTNHKFKSSEKAN